MSASHLLERWPRQRNRSGRTATSTTKSLSLPPEFDSLVQVVDLKEEKIATTNDPSQLNQALTAFGVELGEAGGPGHAERGKQLFNTKHGGEWSCASCHHTPPTTEGKHASTGKAIAPLAPAFNAKAFTDEAKVDKWFRRNCKDVFSRECTAAEKADVLAYLLQLK